MLTATARIAVWTGLVLAVSLLASLSLTGAIGPHATDEDRLLPEVAEAVEASYVDPANRFQLTIPEGWVILASAGGPDLYLGKPNENVGISVDSEPWCGVAPADALQLLEDQVSPDRFTMIQLLDPPAPLTLNGHAAAATFFRHTLAEGPALQKEAVILAPEWSSAWTFAGVMGNASAATLAATINATLGTFEVLPGPARTTVSHPAAHFNVTVPVGWTAQVNASIGTETVDLLLTHPELTATIVVASEGRILSGTAAEARQILQEALDQLAAEPGFRVLEPVTDSSVDGHPAANAVLRYQPSTYDLEQTLTVVVGAEWSRDWAIIGTSFSWQSMQARSCVNATLESLHIATAPPLQAITGAMVAHYDWVLLGAVLATVVEGTVLGSLVIRQARRKRT